MTYFAMSRMGFGCGVAPMQSFKKEGQRLRHMLKFEMSIWARGYAQIAGVDEAGMAPLAGPVCAGAVILPRGYKLQGLDDSKKILREVKRNQLATAIKSDAVAWAIGWAGVEEIDSVNIYHAGLLAMRRAVQGLSVHPDYVLVDARTIPGITQPQQGIVKGDAKSLSIAAGSILAKTTRDHLLNAMDEAYPAYGFAAHKGYPTQKHLDAIARFGVLPIHRRSFAPIKRARNLCQVQENRQLAKGSASLSDGEFLINRELSKRLATR